MKNATISQAALRKASSRLSYEQLIRDIAKAYLFPIKYFNYEDVVWEDGSIEDAKKLLHNLYHHERKIFDKLIFNRGENGTISASMLQTLNLEPNKIAEKPSDFWRYMFVGLSDAYILLKEDGVEIASEQPTEK